MFNETEDNEFEVLLEDKRHKEILSALRNIAQKLSEEKKEDNTIEQAILKQSGSILSFIDAVKSISPKVNVETNQSEVVNSLNDMCGKILQGLTDLQKSIDNKPKEWDFTIQRDFGYITKVIAKAK